MQTFIVVATTILFASMTLSINNNLNDYQSEMLQREVQITGMGYAQELIEQISQQPFDEKILLLNGLLGNLTDLTPLDELGPDVGESALGIIDDLDDFHGLVFQKDSPRIDGFELKVKVSYADTSNPAIDALTPTALKRIHITMKNPNYLEDSLEVSTIVSYY